MKPEDMMISYDGLWALLKERRMKKKDLQRLTSLSSAVIAKMSKGQSVHLDTLIKACKALKCNIADIVEIRPAKDAVKSERSERKEGKTV